MKKIILLLSIMSILPYSSYADEASCGGKERWSVKVLSDKDSSSINFVSKSSTIEDLRNLKIVKLKQGHDIPRQSFEKQIYTIKAKIIKYKHESDADLHIVLIDPKTGNTMIAESPDPTCYDAAHSNHANVYTNVRKEIASYTLKSSKSGWSTVKPGIYEVTGVLFQDFIHGQTGVAPNGIELHPILDVKKIQ